MQRVDVFLSTKLRKFSRNKIQNLIHKKAILVNSKSIDADYKVQFNDVIEVFSPFKEFNENITPENIPLHIVFEDSDIIVVNKPQGMPVHKGLGNYKGTLLNALAYHFLSETNKVNIEAGSVHRLDSGTSGLLVFAKNKNAQNNLEHQLKCNKMNRTYEALVWGIINQEEGTVDVPVGRSKTNSMLIQAFPMREEGKEAVTNYKVLQRFKFATLVQCTLQTGRTHQIRIHMQYLGHAIIGDHRYSSNFTFKEVREVLETERVAYQLLHARYLEFEHPLTKMMCRFEAPRNDVFQGVLSRLAEFAL
ncbi:MAG: RluA family pseudouridine synthase [Bacteroidetes bacterium]|nr:RluA family pseudouridine synthase [Bacteroidota bacterium]